jgi:hypothetical protein
VDDLLRGLGIERHLLTYPQRRREDGLLRGQDYGAAQGISSPELLGDGFLQRAREDLGEMIVTLVPGEWRQGKREGDPLTCPALQFSG